MIEGKITGNKGEWSEVYTLFKLLGDGKVHAGDADMNKLPLYYPIIDIIRKESHRFDYMPNPKGSVVVINSDGEEYAKIPMQRFLEEAEKLLEKLKEKKERAFNVASTEKFMKEIGASKLKAPSTDKSDITIVIHDLRTSMRHKLGFSIKSQIGHPSTLLNAGTTTNIAFRITGVPMDDDEAASINNISKHLPRIEAIYSRGHQLQFSHIRNTTFENNLLFLDSCMPEFIARCLIIDSQSSDSTVRHAVEEVAKDNPFEYKGNVVKYYEHKMKQLLLASALGMVPTREWTGKFDANGGYLVVKSDGDIVCYHFYNQNDVEDYLYNNTRFERASRTRYDFGRIYKETPEASEFYLDLNLQIRFIK